MKADAQTEAAVKAVMDGFAEYYAKRDLDGILALFAPDPDVVMYGTGADEKRVGLSEIKAQAERDWSQSDAASLTYEWTSVSSAGSVAWLAGDVVINAKIGEQEVTLPARFTGVFENREGKWLVVQAHISLGAQAEGESFPT